MNRVLLTGASGFVGRHCLSALMARGYEVHAVSTRADNAYPAGVVAHQSDLLDPVQLRALVAAVQPTHLLHLAWYAQPGVYWASLENIRWVQASLELLQAFAAHGGQRVVLVGSCAEYDWSAREYAEATTPLLPATLYGKAKHALALLAHAWAEQAQVQLAHGRLFFLYGPHEYPTRLVPAVIRALLRGEIALCSHGEQIRDFLYVQDAADALVALLDSNVYGAVNIASGQPIQLKQIIYQIADRLGRCDLVALGALPAVAHEPPRLVANVARLTSEVAWQPAYTLARGLEQTIQWWQAHDQLA